MLLQIRIELHCRLQPGTRAAISSSVHVRMMVKIFLAAFFPLSRTAHQHVLRIWPFLAMPTIFSCVTFSTVLVNRQLPVYRGAAIIFQRKGTLLYTVSRPQPVAGSSSRSTSRSRHAGVSPIPAFACISTPLSTSFPGRVF